MINLSRRDREAIFKRVCRAVETERFNPELNVVDWASVVEARRDRILQIESPEEFEKEMHELVSQLKTSHPEASGGFFPACQSVGRHQSARSNLSRAAICRDAEEFLALWEIPSGACAQQPGLRQSKRGQTPPAARATGPVFAYREEIDRWLNQQPPPPASFFE